jgi:hypothetical protein
VGVVAKVGVAVAVQVGVAVAVVVAVAVQVGVAVAVVVAVVVWVGVAAAGVGVAAAGVGVAATCSSGRSGAGSALNELLAPGIKPDLVMPLAAHIGGVRAAAQCAPHLIASLQGGR